MPPILNEKAIDQWAITDLQQELQRRNLPTDGLKEELVDRLWKDILADAVDKWKFEGSGERMLVPTQHIMGGSDSFFTLHKPQEKVTVHFVPSISPTLQSKTYDLFVDTTTSELSEFLNSIIKSVHEDHELTNFEFLVDGQIIEQSLQEFLFARRFENEVIEIEYVESIGSLSEHQMHQNMVRSPVNRETQKNPFLKANYSAFIPKPQGQFMPSVLYKGTCLGHSIAETISSRLKYYASREAMSIVDAEIVSVLRLVSEFLDAGIIGVEGGLANAAVEYLLKNGAPLESGGRVTIKDVTKTALTRLNDPAISNLPDEEFESSLAKVIAERGQLCSEIAEKGPVVGFFRAGDSWMHANGEIYYDREDYMTAVSKVRSRMEYFGHCVLVYGVESHDESLMDLVLDVQDSAGEESHESGSAHMHISALTAYLSPVLQ